VLKEASYRVSYSIGQQKSEFIGIRFSVAVKIFLIFPSCSGLTGF
jgi:hypothetical protein